MTKHLLAGVAAVVLMSGVASAQVYPLAPPPSYPSRAGAGAGARPLRQLRSPAPARRRLLLRPQRGVTARQRLLRAWTSTVTKSSKRMSTRRGLRAVRKPTRKPRPTRWVKLQPAQRPPPPRRNSLGSVHFAKRTSAGTLFGSRVPASLAGRPASVRVSLSNSSRAVASAPMHLSNQCWSSQAPANRALALTGPGLSALDTPYLRCCRPAASAAA